MLIQNGGEWIKKEVKYNKYTTKRYSTKKTEEITDICDYVIKTTNINLLEWSFENGCKWNNKSMSNVIEMNNLNLLKWAIENGCERNQSSNNNIINFNNIELLKWSFENRCELNEDCIHAAIKTSNNEILQWVIEHGCKWNNYNYTDIKSIIKTNNTDMFIWAIENGCKWINIQDSDSNRVESNSDNEEEYNEAEYYEEEYYNSNVDHDSIEYICYDLYKNNDESIYSDIIIYGNIDMLKFIIDNTSSNINLEKLAVIAVKEMKGDIIDWLEDKVKFSLICKYDLCIECAMNNGRCFDCNRREMRASFNTRNSYFDDDNWSQRAHDRDDAFRRQD